jgi:hypothetical protein
MYTRLELLGYERWNTLDIDGWYSVCGNFPN